MLTVRLKIQIFRSSKKLAKKKPYSEIIKELNQYFKMEENTDINDDVCFSYSITKGDLTWLMQISMIGKYALLINSKEKTTEEYSPETEKEYEKIIKNLLNKNGIKILEQKILEQDLGYTGDFWEMGNVYNFLFSDTDFLPWGEQPLQNSI